MFWSPDGLGDAVFLTLPVNTLEVWLPGNLLSVSPSVVFVSFADVPLVERVRLVGADGLGEAGFFMLPVNALEVWLPEGLLSVCPSFVDVLLAERVELVDATSLRSFSVCEPVEVVFLTLPVNALEVWLPEDLLWVSPSFVDEVPLEERVRLVDATSLRSFSVCEPVEVDVACSNPAIM